MGVGKRKREREKEKEKEKRIGEGEGGDGSALVMSDHEITEQSEEWQGRAGQGRTERSGYTPIKPANNLLSSNLASQPYSTDLEGHL